MRTGLALVLIFLMTGCEPEGTSPGLWLSGEVKPFAEDWTFTDEHGEIQIEVSTPYLLAHSVTIWCAQLDGNLFVGAGQAATKNWPGWVDDDPDVVLKIAGNVYEARLTPVTDETEIIAIQAAFAEKYNLGEPATEASTTGRLWSVGPRAAEEE